MIYYFIFSTIILNLFLLANKQIQFYVLLLIYLGFPGVLFLIKINFFSFLLFININLILILGVILISMFTFFIQEIIFKINLFYETLKKAKFGILIIDNSIFINILVVSFIFILLL